MLHRPDQGHGQGGSGGSAEPMHLQINDIHNYCYNNYILCLGLVEKLMAEIL